METRQTKFYSQNPVKQAVIDELRNDLGINADAWDEYQTRQALRLIGLLVPR